jgi:hypothetical protein
MNHMDVSTFVRPTWKQTYEAFLAYTDATFLPSNLYQLCIIEWRKIHGKKGQSAQDFLLEFESALWSLNEAADYRKIPRPSAGEITRQLTAALPNHVRDEILKFLPDFEEHPYDHYRARLQDIWLRTAWPDSSRHSAPAPRARLTNASPAQAVHPRRDNNDTRMRRCGLVVSYDTAPAVPAHLRGSIYADDNRDLNLLREIVTRRNACIQANVCEYCRRPRSEHHAVSAQFKEINRSPGHAVQSQRGRPRARIADVPGPRVEEVTDDASSASVSLSVD